MGEKRSDIEIAVIFSLQIILFPNPLRDQDRKTEQIALNILTQMIHAAEKKKKWEEKKYY